MHSLLGLTAIAALGCQSNLSPQLPAAAAILIEAENFDECETSEPNTPRAHDLAWASGRTGLIRFPQVERVSWRFQLPTPRQAPCEVWLRYAAAREVPVRWSIDDGTWIETRVPPTGALKGRGAWGWALLGTFAASSNEQTLSLAGAGLRPDCFSIQAAGGGMPDWPPPLSTVEHPTEVLEMLRAGAPRATPEWLQGAEQIRLPTWIEEARAGLHTRLSLAWVAKPLFERAEDAAAALGAPAIVRHVKSMRGECYWQSEHGTVAPWVPDATADGVDPVAAMARRAHGSGLAFVAYYRHQEDRPLAQEHPDWVCRDAAGRTIRTGREPRLCYHSPFGGVTLERLLELADRGADGVYLDESHQPLEGCWCDWTRAAFLRETGLPLPPAAQLEDPLYRRFVDFTEDSLARELWHWRESLHARHPEFALLVSTYQQPDLLEARPTLRLASVADVVKTEFASSARPSREHFFDEHPELIRPARDPQLALGWAMSRDGAFGRPPHVWVHNLPTARHWRAAAAAIIVSGGLANLDHPERTLPDAKSFAEAFELARELAIPLAGARPIPDLLLHLPERARNALLPDQVKAWTQVCGPFTTAWEALLGAHQPVRILSDDQLAGGLPEGARILCLPARERLEGAQQAVLERFVDRGGIVLDCDPAPLVSAARDLALPASLETAAQVQAHWFRAPDGALVLGITNRPAWILDERATPPPAVVGARLRVAEGIRTVTAWPGGEELAIVDGTHRREVRLPAFQEALVLRIAE